MANFSEAEQEDDQHIDNVHEAVSHCHTVANDGPKDEEQLAFEEAVEQTANAPIPQTSYARQSSIAQELLMCVDRHNLPGAYYDSPEQDVPLITTNPNLHMDAFFEILHQVSDGMSSDFLRGRPRQCD